MPFGFFDPTMIIIIPAMLFAMYAQANVSGTFKKFSNTTNKRGLTGADVALKLLEVEGVFDVTVEHIPGNLSDHYDPKAKVLRLSDSVFGSTSLAAVGVAAHETGHAIQHNRGYAPLILRNSILPIVNIGSNVYMPLIFIGFLLSSFRGALGQLLVLIGIIMFSTVLAFQIVTLPVEFNASNRAIEILSTHNILDNEEITPARKVLNAAAMTYVAAAAVSLSQLLRFVLLFMSGRRRD